jgi:hypothetical protein
MIEFVKSEWKGGDAYIIGGGSSLRTFNWEFLIGRHTLGANEAFRKGPEICSRVLFADWKWWKTRKFDLEVYAQAGGVVYSVCPDTERFHIPWLHQLRRASTPLLSTRNDMLGWNNNTGAAAINLACHLGAKRIFLLGFDMTANPEGQTHWHNWRGGPTPATSYKWFVNSMRSLAAGLASRAEVFNVTDGSTKLPWFPKIGFKEMQGMSR